MADQDYTSKRRAARKSGEDPEWTLLEAIEEERSRLMKAESVLDCALVAMDEAEGSGTSGGAYYPSAVEAARDLVKESINRLDSVNLTPLIEKLKGERKPAEKGEPGSGGYEVREPGAVYLVHRN